MDIEKEFEELKELIESLYFSGYSVDMQKALSKLKKIKEEVGV